MERPFICGSLSSYLSYTLQGHLLFTPLVLALLHNCGLRQLAITGWHVELIPLLLGGAMIGCLVQSEQRVASGRFGKPMKCVWIEQMFAATGGVAVGLLIWMVPSLAHTGLSVALTAVTPTTLWMCYCWQAAISEQMNNVS